MDQLAEAQAFKVWCIWSMTRCCNVRLRATQQMVLLFKKERKKNNSPSSFIMHLHFADIWDKNPPERDLNVLCGMFSGAAFFLCESG